MAVAAPFFRRIKRLNEMSIQFVNTPNKVGYREAKAYEGNNF